MCCLAYNENKWPVWIYMQLQIHVNMSLNGSGVGAKYYSALKDKTVVYFRLRW